DVVGAAGDFSGGAGADQGGFVGGVVGEPGHGGEELFLLVVGRAEVVDSSEDSVGDVAGGGAGGDATAAGVAGEEGDVEALVSCARQVVEHFDRVVLVMAYGEEGF